MRCRLVLEQVHWQHETGEPVIWGGLRSAAKVESQRMTGGKKTIERR